MPRDHLVADALGKGVDGVERRQGDALHVGLKGGGCHGVAVLPRDFHFAVKAEGGAYGEGIPQVFLVEEGDLTGPALVKGAELAESHTALDAGHARLG